MEPAKELFFRHYDLIGRTISSTLAGYSLPADDGYEKRSELENHVVQSIFLDETGSRLCQYRLDLGSFPIWLKTVVRNTVISWLRKQKDRPLGLDATGGDAKAELTNITARANSDETGSSSPPPFLTDEAFADLSKAERSTAVVRLLPYRTWSQEDIRITAEVATREADELQHLAGRMVNDFIESQDYAEYWLADQQLEELLRTLTSRERRMRKLELAVGTEAAEKGEIAQKVILMQRKQIEALTANELCNLGFCITSDNLADRLKDWLLSCWAVAKARASLTAKQTHVAQLPVPLPPIDRIADIMKMAAKKARNYFDAARRRIRKILGIQFQADSANSEETA